MRYLLTRLCVDLLSLAIWTVILVGLFRLAALWGIVLHPCPQLP